MFFLGGIFKVVRISWEEWVISIAIGFGSIPVALLTKFLTRRVPLRGCGWGWWGGGGLLAGRGAAVAASAVCRPAAPLARSSAAGSAPARQAVHRLR